VSASSNTEIVDAHAKLNLFLRVLGRRPDGYHEVETAILPISLADRLTIHASAEPGLFRTLSLELRLTGDPDLVAGVPADESNLVVRAATELAGRGGTKGFAEITLHKRVPSAAGLGGGSADAAATLHALNRLWGAGLDAGSLMDVAARVGSDVPALLFGAPLMARGRGELLEPFPTPAFRWLILPLPFAVSTADAYRWWDEDGEVTGPDPAALCAAATAADGDVGSVGRLLFNDLEAPVTRRHPAITEAKARLQAAGAAGVVMTGSGPTVVGLFREEPSISVDGAIEVESWPSVDGGRSAQDA
jgi:4-diphosphocytidyl-2-C-methyl-D-erythritol kinase